MKMNKELVASIAASNIGAFAIFNPWTQRVFAFASTANEAEKIADAYRSGWGYRVFVLVVDESMVETLVAAAA